MAGTSGTDKIPKTPTHGSKTIEMLPAGAPQVRELKHTSMSPPPSKNAGSLMNQNEWRKSPTEDWKINTTGTNDFKNTSYGRVS